MLFLHVNLGKTKFLGYSLGRAGVVVPLGGGDSPSLLTLWVMPSSLHRGSSTQTSKGKFLYLAKFSV